MPNTPLASARVKIFGILTYSQFELIKELYLLAKQRRVKEFWTPKELGAYRNSHHAWTLKRLEAKGLVEVENIAKDADGRAAYAYRITEQGMTAWELAQCCLEDTQHVEPDNVSVRLMRRLTAGRQ